MSLHMYRKAGLLLSSCIGSVVCAPPSASARQASAQQLGAESRAEENGRAKVPDLGIRLSAAESDDWTDGTRTGLDSSFLAKSDVATLSQDEMGEEFQSDDELVAPSRLTNLRFTLGTCANDFVTFALRHLLSRSQSSR